MMVGPGGRRARQTCPKRRNELTGTFPAATEVDRISHTCAVGHAPLKGGVRHPTIQSVRPVTTSWIPYTKVRTVPMRKPANRLDRATSEPSMRLA
jgi:hypothetical protein